MALQSGDRVVITGGPNKRKHGTFVRYTGVMSCYVLLDGKQESQMIRRGNVEKLVGVETATPDPTPANVGSAQNVSRTQLINEARALHARLGNVLDQLEKLEL